MAKGDKKNSTDNKFEPIFTAQDRAKLAIEESAQRLRIGHHELKSDSNKLNAAKKDALTVIKALQENPEASKDEVEYYAKVRNFISVFNY